MVEKGKRQYDIGKMIIFCLDLINKISIDLSNLLILPKCGWKKESFFFYFWTHNPMNIFHLYVELDFM